MGQVSEEESRIDKVDGAHTVGDPDYQAQELGFYMVCVVIKVFERG